MACTQARIATAAGVFKKPFRWILQRHKRIVGVHCGNGFVPEREGITQILHDLRFRLNGSRPVEICALSHWSLRLAQDRIEEQVVRRCNMLYLLRECTNALEIAIGWRERILILGHGIRSRDELALDYRELRIQDRCNRWSLGLGLGLGLDLGLSLSLGLCLSLWASEHGCDNRGIQQNSPNANK